MVDMAAFSVYAKVTATVKLLNHSIYASIRLRELGLVPLESILLDLESRDWYHWKAFWKLYQHKSSWLPRQHFCVRIWNVDLGHCEGQTFK